MRLFNVFNMRTTETKSLKVAFVQGNETVTTNDLSKIQSKVKNYTKNLSKYTACHGVDLHHLFKVVNDQLNDISEICDNNLVKPEFISISNHLSIIWTILGVIEEKVPKELFDDLELLLMSMDPKKS